MRYESDIDSSATERIYNILPQHIMGQCVLILSPELSVDKNGVGYKTKFLF